MKMSIGGLGTFVSCRTFLEKKRGDVKSDGKFYRFLFARDAKISHTSGTSITNLTVVQTLISANTFHFQRISFQFINNLSSKLPRKTVYFLSILSIFESL